ncbi:transcriptional regulator [Marinobacter halodurans]|uniref:Transcriptional regulator n=1 Tax=Marinobacter halodurans TaxID=2528979 RepID=A0ABY1ZGV8_9GAMM|nr:helix-turn-helix domain-containing protein [Marinobacter halodurans]TBW51287.1 transcriptional regulator [Marinobacter halodurans]
MAEGPNIVRLAALIGDNARAAALSTLMAGRALTATELADAAGVTRQTMSSHLAKLLECGLLQVGRQGKHRYFRLAGPEVAHLLESLMGMTPAAQGSQPLTGPRDQALRKARICYDHLAGELGVYVYDGMLGNGVLRQVEDGLRLTDHGQLWFRRLGIDTHRVSRVRRTFCRTCLDWSERRDHLAGALGAAFLSRIEELGWAARLEGSRVMAFSEAGERSLRSLFGGVDQEPEPPIRCVR